jgi:hydroxypyruvate reductase
VVPGRSTILEQPGGGKQFEAGPHGPEEGSRLMQEYLKTLETIFTAAVARVDPNDLIVDAILRQGDHLTIKTDDFQQTFNLADFERIIIIGAGKATAKMALAMEKILGARISEGIISVKYGHTENLTRIQCIEAGHPIPDENGLEAARRIADLARTADEKTLVITLISGGGSALIPLPYTSSDADGQTIAVSLTEKQDVTRILLECGATINEINCLRKHLSHIKGGHLARMIHPAASVNLILSDVVGDDLDAIASGPTTHDNSTFNDVNAIVEKYDIDNRLPETVRRLFRLGMQGKIPDTPAMGDPVFNQVHNILVGTNFLSLQAAAEKARQLGLPVVMLSSQVVGEAREVAKVLCGIAKDAKKHSLFGPPPLCLIAGGETTVTLLGKGKGGRNQEMALAFLAEIEKNPGATRGIYFLSASTDGNDGPTDAAGAFAANEILAEAHKKGLFPNAYIKASDGYRFFDRIGALLKTGPTNTNVCDIQLILIS